MWIRMMVQDAVQARMERGYQIVENGETIREIPFSIGNIAQGRHSWSKSRIFQLKKLLAMHDDSDSVFRIWLGKLEVVKGGGRNSNHSTEL